MRILIVEDNVANVDAAKDVLADHDLIVVEGFDQALEALEKSVEISKEDCESLQADVEHLISGVGFTELAVYGETIYLEAKKGDRWQSVRLAKSELADDAKTQIEAAAEKYRKRFDAVLTDVMFPKGGTRCMGDEGRELVRRQGAMPYGPIVALLALQLGVKKVGIITSGNHHADPFVFAFDDLHGLTFGDTRVIMTNRMEAKVGEETWVKDWKKLLGQLFGEDAGEEG